MLLIVNHAFAERLAYQSTGGARDALAVVLAAIGRATDLFDGVPRVHPMAWSSDVGGGATLHQWTSRVAASPDLHDVAEQLVRFLSVGPFLELDAAELVPRGSVVPALPDSAYAELALSGLAEVLYGQGAVLISVGAEASGLDQPEYHSAHAELQNLRSPVEVEDRGVRWLEREAANFGAVLEQLERTAPRVRLAQSVRADIERGRAVLRPGKLRELALALEAAALAHGKGEDWVAGFVSASSAEIRSESDSVLASPSLRNQRKFRLSDGRSQLCTWHVTVTKGDRAYVWVESTPDGALAHLAYVGKHLPTKKY